MKIEPGELQELYLEPERYELREELPYHFELDRREFFKVLGCGVVVLLLIESAVAQESGGGRRGGRNQPRPTELSAWLHIGEDGTVTVFTGKAEMGQNIRTSLSQAVVEELRAPIAQVRLVMADTALTPFDAGTFGSRTTPEMAAYIRRVAVAAREALLDLAAEHFKTERTGLTVADGKISGKESGQSITFGELTKGRQLVKSVSENANPAPATEWKVAGTSVSKVDGRDFVTGKHRYPSDIARPGMLHGKILRPPSFDATLTAADTKAAESISGVRVVRDDNFIGVTAANQLIATQAVNAIKADWSTKPQSSDAKLFDDLRKNSDRPMAPTGSSGEKPATSTEGEHRLRQTYTVAYIAHVPLEPRAAVAEWEGEKLTVWTGTQRPFGVRGELAQAFRIPEAQVRVIVPDTGSGYGGKHSGEVAIEAARLAKAAGKPVKLVWTREEEFTFAYFRPAGVIDISSAVRSDGTIAEWEFHNYNSGASGIRSPYDVPDQKNEFHQSRSPLRQGSYRGLAATANHFARETHIDELAALVKMDPLEFRLRNLKDARLRAVLEAAAKTFGWGNAKSSRERGFGIAGGSEKGGYVATCAEVAIDNRTGSVRVVRAVTAFECGAVVNPDHLKNQVEGAVVMGLGGALFEAVTFDNGRITNAHLSDYRVPRFADVPEIEVVLVNRKDLPSAGAGETPIVGIAPAVGNAIYAASGTRLRSLPMVPDGLKI
jgi:isoquinoline 1-oxidoreductase